MRLYHLAKLFHHEQRVRKFSKTAGLPEHQNPQSSGDSGKPFIAHARIHGFKRGSGLTSEELVAPLEDNEEESLSFSLAERQTPCNVRLHTEKSVDYKEPGICSKN